MSATPIFDQLMRDRPGVYTPPTDPAFAQYINYLEWQMWLAVRADITAPTSLVLTLAQHRFHATEPQGNKTPGAQKLEGITS